MIFMKMRNVMKKMIENNFNLTEENEALAKEDQNNVGQYEGGDKSQN